MKKIIRLLIAAALLLFAIFTGAAFYLSSQVMYPAVHCNKGHYIYCGGPDEQGIHYQGFTVTTSDGVKLTGWYMPAPHSDKGIILVHGHGGSIHEGMRYAPALLRAGFNVAAFSLRGNMKAGAKSFYSMGYHEKKDVKAVLDFMKQKKGMKSIGIFGFSMGASTAILAMADNADIKAGIFNTAYADVKEQLADIGRRQYGLPSFPLLNAVMELLELRGEIDFSRARPVESIEKISPRPIYIWHSTGDNYIQIKHGEQLFSAAKEPKKFWKAPCKGHVRIWNCNRKAAETRAVEFFTQNL